MISSQILANAHHIQTRFQAARPFKHAYIPDFLDAEIAEALLRDFPAFDRQKAMNEFGEVGRKAVNTRLADISPLYKRFYDYLFSAEFLRAMSAISGIPDLIGDISLYGGGTHENLNGQELDPHVDFNYVQGGGAHRRMNLLIYLNKGWEPEWGGAIELHSNPRDPDTNEIKAFNVDFNKALLFETNEYSWHGFPRIQLPPELATTRSRKCLSIYLYTRTRPIEEIAGTHATFYVQRPLAKRFQEGHRLAERDVQELEANYRGRDRYIEYYQKLEERLGRRIQELEELAATRAADVKFPLIGFATPVAYSAGEVWSDGWAPKHLSVELKATRRLTRLELRVVIPDSLPAGVRQFVVRAGEARETFETSRPGTFTFTIALRIPAGESFNLSVDCDVAFNPAAAGAGSDPRDLAYLLQEVAAESA
jgi:Rps23 Pro-64 3,4-dihydroxylase Tpa1-like proline 4-hydroxylase